MLAIETGELTKRFRHTLAVDGLALTVPAGCVYGFLGPNGAGKTTAIRLLLGLLRPNTGMIRIMGHDLRAERAKALSSVGAMLEGTSLYDHMSGRDNLGLTRSVLRLPRSEIDRVLDIVDLRHAAGQRVATYSLGMKQRLALARALMGTPGLLLLDEPTNGLDPDGIMAMRILIRELPGRINGTVFLSSHLLSEVEHVADEVGLINHGKLVLQGGVQELIRETPSLLVSLDAVERGAALLKSAGVDVLTMSGDTLELQAPRREAAQYFAAAVNRQLVEGGCAVHALMFKARTLEDVYRKAVRATPSDVADTSVGA